MSVEVNEYGELGEVPRGWGNFHDQGSFSLHRFINQKNRVLAGAVLETWAVSNTSCQTEKFSKFNSRCASTQSNEESYGVDAVFQTGSTYYDPVAANHQAKYYPDESELNRFGVPYGFRSFDMKDSQRSRSFPVLIDVNLDESRAIEMVDYIQECVYFAEMTTHFTLTLLTFNGASDLFTMVRYNIVYDDSGTLYIKDYIESIRTEQFKDAGDYVRATLEVIFAIFFLKSMWSEVMEALAVRRTHGTIGPYLSSIFNIIDMLAFVCTSAVIVAYVILLKLMHEFDLEERYHVYESLSGYDAEGEHVNWLQLYKDGDGLSELAEKLDEFKRMGYMKRLYNFLTTLTITFTLLRMLKLMDFHPDIGMITRTIRHGKTDLLNFMVLLVLVLLIYTVSGHILFGGNLTMFHRLRDSALTCFTMMLGDTTFSEDIPNLGGTYEILSGVFFFVTFMVIVFLFLLNALMAIIMNALSSVKHGAENDDVEEHFEANLVSELRDLVMYSIKNAVAASRKALNRAGVGRAFDWERTLTDSDIRHQIAHWDSALRADQIRSELAHRHDSVRQAPPGGGAPKKRSSRLDFLGQPAVVRMEQASVNNQDMESVLLGVVEKFGFVGSEQNLTNRNVKRQLSNRNALYTDSDDAMLQHKSISVDPEYHHDTVLTQDLGREEQRKARHFVNNIMKDLGHDEHTVHERIMSARIAELERSRIDRHHAKRRWEANQDQRLIHVEHAVNFLGRSHNGAHCGSCDTTSFAPSTRKRVVKGLANGVGYTITEYDAQAAARLGGIDRMKAFLSSPSTSLQPRIKSSYVKPIEDELPTPSDAYNGVNYETCHFAD
ncbi:hypothetical protein CYMTET_55689 [Cymbomonas tetramitiformis]|uniref:Polycystin cation channel PKD1/PKD2 domain-containing protein n=1 Tax=Cymbomonas tetramitiformis TaxID=36881 RepID=A0AAE0BDM6_9CHLO|nr:hypothetical protein CYMTET_55689 [Cymbomonas tetramitiformis]